MEAPFDDFLDNALQALELLKLHEEKNSGKKTHHTHEVLTKSCAVLLVACWEAFIEDAAEAGLSFIIDNVKSPTNLPKELLKSIALELKVDKNDIKVWELADGGWKLVAKSHYKAMLSKHLGPFNTPRAGNIDDLYKNVLGLETLSACWTWKHMPNKQSKDKLSALISLRGSIAHRINTSHKVTRKLVDGYASHLLFLAIKTNNRIRRHVYQSTGLYPWNEVTYRSIK
ncbi:hypothetical protein MIZ01_0326 [Sideroxyarcus emersonii]|uniref:RiboL-PSP-HEPN domain-containing protein n=1 Tax=Sideroxyarcus emersonii TaxID=2764705 RepID=A0AAN1X880_9PROT|nr:HEPN domain-containing protein [Sideroxyarcus emersonii]BCK86563.1 hypothetical protein MIZ01_0326 [Sideroxyarcus emersonii]